MKHVSKIFIFTGTALSHSIVILLIPSNSLSSQSLDNGVAVIKHQSLNSLKLLSIGMIASDLNP